MLDGENLKPAPEAVRPPPVDLDVGSTTTDLASLPNGHAMVEKLAAILGEIPKVPAIGAEASASIRRCAEEVATAIDTLAQEHVNRALALQQEFQSFSSTIRLAGGELCSRVEQETARGLQVVQALWTARKLIEEEPKPDPA